MGSGISSLFAPVEWSMIYMGRRLSEHGESLAKIGHAMMDAALTRLLARGA